MEKPKYQNFRVCYENGNAITGKEIYELHKLCNCSDCKNRKILKKEAVNCATATTKDIFKVDEVAEFLENWTCENGKKHLNTAYFKF
ncbi:hypothetical protein [Clostridium botulinum]|uniref:hypothetical protein n=1 Tax=Clostridium botulinum TaxID=1491 RepID=UPI003DA1DED1